MEFLIEWDTNLFLFLNQFHSDFWDPVMWWISEKTSWYPFYGILIGIIIWNFKWRSIPALIAIALLITASDQSSVQLFKQTIQRLRPTYNPEIQDMIHTIHGYTGGKFGFVSSHAANSFAAATFLSYLFKNRYFSVFIYLWAAVVSYSRIYLGVHYPGDILGGAILGVILGIAIYSLFRYFDKKYFVSRINQ